MVQFYTSNETPDNKSRIMVNGKKKTTNKKKNRERCQGFDKCLLSVLSQFKAITKFKLKKEDKIEVFQ